MNVQAPIIRTADDFLRWNEGREGKREFVRGRVIEMMVGGTRRHAELTLQLATLLKVALPDRRITASDFAIRTPFGIRYPDVLIEGGSSEPDDLATAEPAFAAEILSPSSLAVDFGEKANEYTQIPSLLHYLVLAQDEPRVWLWSRGENGAFGKPEMIVGREESVPLAGFGISLPLAELYRGVG